MEYIFSNQLGVFWTWTIHVAVQAAFIKLSMTNEELSCEWLNTQHMTTFHLSLLDDGSPFNITILFKSA